MTQRHLHSAQAVEEPFPRNEVAIALDSALYNVERIELKFENS